MAKAAPRPYSILEFAPLLALWERALATPHGIKIRSTKPATLQMKLYAVRRDCGHQRFAAWSLAERGDHVWIIPKER